MNIREEMEKREHEIFSPFAAFSNETRGRDEPEEECDVRPAYQRDRDRILHCKSFRRLKDKTQVFLAPEGDHYRTRLTHTLEVAQIARTIAKALLLNEDLTEAIALGHDLGHTPFGHAGERALNQVSSMAFCHNEQSVRVVELLEKGGKGMNLTWEVRDGIRSHQTAGKPSTLEGAIVRLADKIAYINHDIDDAIRGHIIKEEEIPVEYREIIGKSCRERLNTLIHDIIINSSGKNQIAMSQPVEDAMFSLRKFMFAHVYTNPAAKGQEHKAEGIVMELFQYYQKHIELLPKEYVYLMEKRNQPQEQIVCDYIAGMTDRYAIAKYRQIKIPIFWDVL